MKNFIYFFRFSVASLTLSIATVVFSCANNNEPALPSNTQDKTVLIEKSKQFATFHNECIKNTLSSLSSSQNRQNHITSFSIINSEVYLITDNYINGKLSRARNTEVIASYNDTIKNITSHDVTAIRNDMTPVEIAFVDHSITLYEKGEALDRLMIDVEQSDLPITNKEAILNFMSTLEASSEYWEAEGEEWIEFLENNLPEEELQKFSFYDKKGKIQWKQVAFADAYYGWFGTVSTGGNLIVGAGAAAAGSIFSALNFF